MLCATHCVRTNRGWAFQRAQSTASLEIAKQLLQKKKEAADAAANANDPGRTDSSGSASGEDRTAKLKALLEAAKGSAKDQEDKMAKLRNGLASACRCVSDLATNPQP